MRSFPLTLGSPSATYGRARIFSRRRRRRRGVDVPGSVTEVAAANGAAENHNASLPSLYLLRPIGGALKGKVGMVRSIIHFVVVYLSNYISKEEIPYNERKNFLRKKLFSS
jgi:hypothetical protein